MAEERLQGSKLVALSALLFALVGICVGMVFGHSESDRTRVELPVGCLCLLSGAILGQSFGYVLEARTIRSDRLRRNTERTLAILLSGAVLAPIGWLARDPLEDVSGEEAIFRFFGYGVLFALFLVMFGALRKAKPKIQSAEDISNAI